MFRRVLRLLRNVFHRVQVHRVQVQVLLQYPRGCGGLRVYYLFFFYSWLWDHLGPRLYNHGGSLC